LDSTFERLAISNIRNDVSVNLTHPSPCKVLTSDRALKTAIILIDARVVSLNRTSRRIAERKRIKWGRGNSANTGAKRVRYAQCAQERGKVVNNTIRGLLLLEHGATIRRCGTVAKSVRTNSCVDFTTRRLTNADSFAIFKLRETFHER